MASLSRLIPAPVTEEVATKISSMAETIFKTLDCSGVVRIDFLMDRGSSEVWFNEINTIPGSLSFYLWEPTGLSFSALVERLISIAMDRFESRVRRVRTYDVNLLSERSASGLKGNKS
jgi:D-alanine-D-alanine ligase